MFFCYVYTVTSGTFGQDLSENMGLRSLNERLQDPSLAAWFGNLFPRDSPRNMRFSINFFTSIGLGGLTDALRRHLAELPKILAAQREAAAAAAEAGNPTALSTRCLYLLRSLWCFPPAFLLSWASQLCSGEGESVIQVLKSGGAVIGDSSSTAYRWLRRFCSSMQHVL